MIGGGNAAIDSARTALRRGAKVTVIYRRERKDMPAIEEETAGGKDEGVKFAFLAAPHRILGDAKGNVKAIEMVKTRLGEYDGSGRRKPMPTDEIQRFECDSVILAVGETFDLDFCRASGLGMKEDGHDRRKPLHAGDDATAILCGRRRDHWCVERVERDGYGKQAAQKIDEQLMEVRRWEQLFPEIEYDLRVPENPS